jgi:NADPH:quinone reductase
MRAVICCGTGGPDVMELRDAAPPELGPEGLRVRVAAVGLNRADLLQRRGLYPPPAGVTDILGLEFAGEIVELGGSVQGWKRGDRCMGLVSGGAYAEEVVLHCREALPIPGGMSWTDAAAIPEAFMTAYDALAIQLGIRMGDRLLIHAVGSGVGNAALQLALSTGARPMGTTRSKWKLDRALGEGLAEGAVAEEGRFLEKLVNRPDKIVDFVGAAYLEQNLQALRPGGKLLIVGLLGGRKAAIDLGLVLAKRLDVRGTVLRSRPLEEKIGLAQSFGKHALPLFQSGRLRPTVDRCFPMAEAAEAHRHMEASSNYGKIVLRW